MSVEDGLVEGSKDGPDAWRARWEAAEEVAKAGVDAGAQQLIKLVRGEATSDATAQQQSSEHRDQPSRAVVGCLNAAPDVLSGAHRSAEHRVAKGDGRAVASEDGSGALLGRAPRVAEHVNSTAQGGGEGRSQGGVRELL